MGCLAILTACVTSIATDYTNLPTVTVDANKELHDISRFYEQKTPNVIVNGYQELGNNDAILFSIDTGAHTEKLDTGGIGLTYKKVVPLSDSWTLAGSVGVDYNYTKNRPCTDSNGSEFYCGNLTTWHTFERKKTHDKTYNVGINLFYTW